MKLYVNIYPKVIGIANIIGNIPGIFSKNLEIWWNIVSPEMWERWKYVYHKMQGTSVNQPELTIFACIKDKEKVITTVTVFVERALRSKLMQKKSQVHAQGIRVTDGAAIVVNRCVPVVFQSHMAVKKTESTSQTRVVKVDVLHNDKCMAERFF